MALQYRKNTVMEGESVVGGVVIEGYRAVINSTDPNSVDFTSWVGDRAKYREHCAEADADRAAFRSKMYEMQNSMMVENPDAE